MAFVIVKLGASGINALKGITLVHVLDEAVELLTSKHGFKRSGDQVAGVKLVLIDREGNQCALVGVDTFA